MAKRRHMTRNEVILAVDDTPEVLEMLTRILGGEGYQVCPADSGELALAAIAAAKPDLILLDMRMHDMDGFEVCRRIKASADSRDIPVIFLSGVAETRDQVEGFALGAVDFVAKPFQERELLARIRTHLELSRLRHHLEQIVRERTAELEAANRRLLVELDERLRAEHSLRESEERFRSMANHAPVMVWTSGPDTKINFCNNYTLELTGRTMDELIGDGWKETVHPDDLEHKYPAYLPLIQAGREYQVEYRVRRSDGEYRWMLDTATPRTIADGSFAGYIGIAVDITDLKQRQEEWLAAQKLESLGLLVSGIAHNFNNLMGTIVAEADLALSELPDDSSAHGNVARINTVALRASNIVATLSAYASGGVSSAPAPMSLSSVVEETLQLIRSTVSRNVTFHVDLARNLPPIVGDISQMRQLVMNLLTNAYEALPDQEGLISVATSILSNPHCIKASPGSDNWIRLSVSDTGCGIAEADRAKIFDPFFTTKLLGRGLGLAAVQGIARGLGGSVQFQSCPGKGSTFEVLLPCIYMNDERSSDAVLRGSPADPDGKADVSEEETPRRTRQPIGRKRPFRG
jgi:PAS domain S-box-containing protein